MRSGSCRFEAARRIELATFEILDKGIAEDAVPSIEQLGHQIAVIDMRRPAPFAWIVTDHGRLLMAIEWLHRGVDIENPRLAQQWPRAVFELLAQPGDPRLLLNLADR